MAGPAPRVQAGPAGATGFAAPVPAPAGCRFRGPGPGARRARLECFDQARTAPSRARRMAAPLARRAAGKRRNRTYPR
jgi:hypothetical protein